MKFSIITLFPEIFSGVFDHSILSRAISENHIEINLVNLRDFGEGKHKTVDDKPYGGGTGMVLRVDVLNRAIEKTRTGNGTEKVAIMDARGEVYTQETAEKFSKIDHLIIICGRYEGFDERIKNYVDYTISMGDFVLTGGEIPAMIIVDSVTRLLPKVLSKKDATQLESFSKSEGSRILEHPQYTRPENFKGEKVPGTLLSGHKAKIDEYRKTQAVLQTKKTRPELLRPASKSN